MKQKHLLAGLILGTILLTGCGSSFDSVTGNTMTIGKDGTISDVSVEDFSEGNYDMADLEAFVNAEIADYNSEAGEDSIVLDAIDTENKLVKLQLTYSGMDDYNAFNNTEYQLEGFEDVKLSGEFTSVADGTKVSVGDMTDSGMKVLKVEDAMNIICKGKVLYYNDNVTEDNGTYIASGDGEAIIVFK